MRYIKTICCVVILCLSVVSFAQETEDAISVRCEVFTTSVFGENEFKHETEKQRTEAYFAVYPSNYAKTIFNEYNKFKNDPDFYDKSDKFISKYNFKKNKDGILTRRIIPGRSIVVIENNERNIKIVEIVTGKNDYILVFESGHGHQTFEKSSFIGEDKRKAKKIVYDPDDGNLHFPIQLTFDKNLLNEDTRLIIRCSAKDCKTGDIVDHCATLVYEGKRYHELQNKRKDYDFFSKDSLAGVFRSTYNSLKADSNMFVIDTVVIYKKRDTNKDYRSLIQYNIEDYHKSIDKGEELGTKLKARPFKFLNFSSSVPEMELSDLFKPQESVVERNIVRDLDLKFVTGRAELRDDSLNEVQTNAIIEELKSYGKRLTDPKIIGSASPEGSNATNQSLARQRADFAKRMILPHLDKAISISTEIKVYTWDDVADRLEQNGMKPQADAVREKIQEIGADQDLPLDRAIYALSCYNDTIKPLLQAFQIMKCTYGYVREHVFTQEEVEYEFENFLEDYRTGKKQFTNTDYFNLFSSIPKGEGRDTLINMAYRYMTQDGYLYRFDPLAPYVFDLKQRLNQKNSIPDTIMLSEYIDLSNDKITHLKSKAIKMLDGVAVNVNYSGHIVTQAISYFLLQKFVTSQSYINWLKDKGVTVPGLENLEHFMNIKSLGTKDNLNIEEKQKLELAKKHVLRTIENKAILFTELEGWASPEEAEKWVDMLDDENPKKWYLKGIIWARKVKGKKGFLSDVQPNLNSYMTEEEEIEARSLDLEAVPHYLAYFHHSFKLSPEFYDRYFSEGHINEFERMDFPYTRQQVPAYDFLFKILQRRDAENRKKHMEDEDMNGEDTETVETPVATEAPAEVAATGNN